jgi:hypothetical protein
MDLLTFMTICVYLSAKPLTCPRFLLWQHFSCDGAAHLYTLWFSGVSSQFFLPPLMNDAVIFSHVTDLRVCLIFYLLAAENVGSLKSTGCRQYFCRGKCQDTEALLEEMIIHTVNYF